MKLDEYVYEGIGVFCLISRAVLVLFFVSRTSRMQKTSEMVVRLLQEIVRSWRAKRKQRATALSKSDFCTKAKKYVREVRRQQHRAKKRGVTGWKGKKAWKSLVLWKDILGREMISFFLLSGGPPLLVSAELSP